MIAGADVLDAGPDGLDHSRTLVAEHDREAPGAQVAVRQVEVGVAHARRRDPNEHLARARRVERDLLHGERRVRARAARRPRRASSDAIALERVEIGLDAEAGPGRRGDRAVGGDLERRGQAASRGGAGVHAGGSSGTSTYGQVDTASARCRLARRPSPFDQVCGEKARPHRSASAAIRRQPPSPPASTTSGWITSTPPRTIRSRASNAPRTISPAAIRSEVRRRSVA